MTGRFVSRRGFVELLGGAALLGLAGTARGQVIDNDDFPGMYGLLVGPEGERPSADGPYIDQWDSYRFVYVATDTGARYWLDSQATKWSQLETNLITYSQSELPTAAKEGHLSFNDERKVIQWYDGDGFEWPTFVDNADVEVSSKTVSNTTTETEVIRADLDERALHVAGRTMILRVFGKYNTAASDDDFTYRVYAGDAGFDPTAGEGTLITEVTTVQENVTDGPWQMKTTMTVFSTGVTGTLAIHSEGAFNDTKNDDQVDPITVDTSTAEEFVGTVQWNNAKAGNSVTRRIGYLQQSA